MASEATFDLFEDHCWRDVIPPEVLDVYAAYRRPVGLRGTTALLAVDLFACVFPSERRPVLDACREDSRSCGHFAWDAVPHIQDLLRLARQRAWPVIFTTSAALGGVTREESRATHREGAAGERDTDYRIDERFPILTGDVVVRKRRASAFFGTDLAHLLRSRGVETVVICGESTSGCVRATAVDAYSHGFHAVVVEECVFDRNELSHKVNLFDLHHKYADVVHLGDLSPRVTGMAEDYKVRSRPTG